MSDLCKHCTYGDDPQACDAAECSVHETSYAKRLRAMARPPAIDKERVEVERFGKGGLKVGAWASGYYLNSCRKCGRQFTGDKRAMYCCECAIRAALSDSTGEG